MIQKVLASIDTEGPAGADPVETMIYSKASNGKEYGIRYLMKMFDERGIRGLFFVDIPEIVDHGEDKIERVLKEIHDNGHDVGVHVHPDHMADINRRHLWEYTRDEQYEIIARCTEFYEKVLKRAPVSFRAGRYGADNNTLSVLDQLGYKYDMSEFYASRYCLIRPEVAWNRIVQCGPNGLKEVPVTTFRSLSVPFYSRNDQIDSGNVPSEFKRNMKLILENGKVDVVSLFFHSFQFIDWRVNPDKPSFSNIKHKAVKKNLDLLERYKNAGAIQYISEKDLDEIPLNKEDPVGEWDASKYLSSYYYFGLRAYQTIKARIIRNV